MTWRERLVNLIRARTGIEVPAASPQLLVTTRERVEALMLGQASDYVNHLEALPGEHGEWQRLIQSVTNHLTHFFRDPDQLATLSEVLQRLARPRGPLEPLHIWSAGCATGEEVYTLAILGNRLGLNLRVSGSDVSRRALETARAGIYDAWSLRHVEKQLLGTCFRLISPSTYQVREEIARRVQFHEHNLVRDRPLTSNGAGWDTIVCRNVLIYYSQDTVRQMLMDFAKVLKPGGALLLGASESVLSLNVPYRLELIGDRVVYFPKVAAVAGAAPPPTSREPSVKRPVNALTSELVAPLSFLEIQPELLTLLTEGELERAQRMLQKVVRHYPIDTVARLSLGHTYLLQHDFEQAQECYQVVCDHEPLIAEAHFFQGVVARRRQQLQLAFAAFRKAVFLEPRFWAASYQLGATASRLGKQAICRSEFERTLSLLTNGQGELPLLTHPVLHARFLDTPDRVLRACRTSG